MRLAVRVLATGFVCLQVTVGTRGHLQAAGQLRPDGPAVATAGQMVISEFRLRGPAGALDEFIEIQNRTGSDHTVAALSGSGYGIAASDGVTRCTIPNGTVIPARGHYLCVNSSGYSLGSYPAGNATTATGNATYTLDVADNAGIAIFNNDAGGGSYSLANRLDAVGSTSEADTLYKEGAGYAAVTPFDIDSSFVRRVGNTCTGTGGGSSGNCTTVLQVLTTNPAGSFLLLDSNNNANDFLFVDTNGTSIGAGQRLGAPGPENLSSPGIRSTGGLTPTRLDTCAATLAAPNKARDVTSDPANNSTFGTYEIRRTWTNTSGQNLTRLRFRVVDLTTFPSIAGVADFRPRTSGDVFVSVNRPPCASGTSNPTVRGTTLETPPSQPNGGGFNSTLSVPAVSAGTPLANGASIDIRFVLGIQQTGAGRFCVMPETLPVLGAQPFCFIGQTDSDLTTRAGDYDLDQHSDLPFFSPSTGLYSMYRSANGAFNASGFGVSLSASDGYTPVPGDYDGDGRFDFGFYQPSTGSWVIAVSGNGYTSGVFTTWGGPGYVPVPGDYDGDGVTDFAVYSAVTGAWSILTSTTASTATLSINWGGPGYTPVPGQDVDGDGRSDAVIYNERLGTWYVLRSSTNFTTSLNKAWGGSGYTLVPGDYDGDGKADFGLYQRSTGAWYVLQSSTSYTSSVNFSFGGMGFIPIPADYDGDGKTDIGVYQLAQTKFLALTSSSAYAPGAAIVKTFGFPSDVPISSSIVTPNSREIDSGDFDGDFTSDLTVYNTTSGQWSMLKSGGSFATGTSINWGGTGYTAASGDWDGDGRRDLGLYHGATGNWLVLLSSSNFTTTLNKNAGGAGYIPVPGDYDGDGKTDFVVYNTASGLWFGLKSSTNYTTTLSVSWGGSGYTAAPGDFDGDGKQDLAIYQASSGNWSILTSTSNYMSSIVRNLGGSLYVPVPADFDGDGFTDFAVYRSSTGVWTVLRSSTGNTAGFNVSYGGAGYTPVAGDWDGDRCADVGVYNASGAWSILFSTGAYANTSLSKNWGGAGYTPVPAFP